ncbi:MAG: hypothetical protein EA424_00695, partial [Planctomycetaceae bacterium]
RPGPARHGHDHRHRHRRGPGQRWLNVASQTGRLLALQDQATHAQIINRLKEQYGDRSQVRVRPAGLMGGLRERGPCDRWESGQQNRRASSNMAR